MSSPDVVSRNVNAARVLAHQPLTRQHCGVAPTHSLWKALFANGPASKRFLSTHDRDVALDDLHQGSYLGGRIAELRGRSVLLSTKDQLSAALALVELDGLARRIILCPPDLSRDHIPFIVSTAGVDAVVTNDDEFVNRATTVSCQ